MRRGLKSLLATLGFLVAAISASAQERVYTFGALHPTHGAIGTFTLSVAHPGDGTTRIDSKLRIAVKILGVVFYREEGEYIEVFRDNRLISFTGTTLTNGERIEANGKAVGEYFVVTTPTGQINAPAGIVPSNPWLLRQVGDGTVVSTKTGRIIPTRVTGGELETILVQGAPSLTRHFVARGERQQETWLNDRDVPLMFRSTEKGAAIDFILTSSMGDAAIAELLFAPAAKVQPEILR